MAHLLGSQNCLESLAVDICDVQETITDIFERVGPVRFPSWKYPDKASCDLDIPELMTRYCYSKDEDHSKLSHIILFELLIDRLVLLVQALSAFCNHLLSSTNSNRPGTAKSVGSAMSVGLVVKKFWNKMAHLYQIVQRELTESDSKFKKVKSMEETIVDMKQETSMLQDLLKKKSLKHGAVKGEIKYHSNKKTPGKVISSHNADIHFECPSASDNATLSAEEVASTKTCNEVATQTYDTAFVPCEACSRTQENLVEVGQMVMKVCESQGLPSSLAKQKRLLKQSLLAAADVSRWAAEQNRDLSRINDHLDNLYAQIQPLQEKLSKSREKRKVLEERVLELEKCIEDEKMEAEKISESISGKLNEVTKEKVALEEKSNVEIKELNKIRMFLETRVEKAEEKLQKSTTANSKLESEHEQLKLDFENEKTETARLNNTDEDLSKTKTVLKEMQNKLQKTTLELGKMEAKNRSLEKHDQALQGKHDALLQRIDELDQECEDLRERVMDVEGERDDLNDALSETKSQNEKLVQELARKQEQLDIIEDDRNKLAQAIQALESDVQGLQSELRETEEKMQLIVEYPSDMGAGNIGQIRNPDGVLDNPGNISVEMEKQILSNNIRIVLLEAQNKKLRHSVEKLTEINQHSKPKQMDDAVLLWNSRNDRPQREEKNQKRSSLRSRITRSVSDSQKTANCNSLTTAADDKNHHHGGFRQGSEDIRQSSDYRPRPPSGSKPEQKNSSQTGREKVFEKRQARALSAKLAGSRKAVDNLLRAGNERYADEKGRVCTTRDDASTTVYEPVNTFVCGGCDKMCTTRKDLDIHREFCYELQT